MYVITTLEIKFRFATGDGDKLDWDKQVVGGSV